MKVQLKEVECSGEVHFKEHFCFSESDSWFWYSNPFLPSVLPFFVSFLNGSILGHSIQPDPTQYIDVIIGIFHYIPEIPFSRRGYNRNIRVTRLILRAKDRWWSKKLVWWLWKCKNIIIFKELNFLRKNDQWPKKMCHITVAVHIQVIFEIQLYLFKYELWIIILLLKKGMPLSWWMLLYLIFQCTFVWKQNCWSLKINTSFDIAKL